MNTSIAERSSDLDRHARTTARNGDPGTPPVTPPADDPVSAAPVASRLRRNLLIAALPLALALVGTWFWATGGRYVGTEDAYVQQDRVSIVSQLSGQIATVGVAENDVVSAGQTLFTIDDSHYRAALESARAKLESARLDVRKLKAAYAGAVSDAATARDSLAFARTQDERQQSLRTSGVISQSSADDSALALQQARGAVAAADTRVLAAEAALAGRPDIAVDEHPAVLEALADVHAAELDLEHTIVEAPEAGIASQTERLQVGQYVTPTTPVLSVVQTGDSWIEANYKETELTHMRVGQPVTVVLDTYPDRTFAGEIASIGAGTGSEFALLPAQNATGNWVKVVQRVPVRIRIGASDAAMPLRAGMSASVEVDTGHARGLPGFLGGEARAEPPAVTPLPAQARVMNDGTPARASTSAR